MAQLILNNNLYVGLSGNTYLGMIPDFSLSASTKGYYYFNKDLLDRSGNGYNGTSGSTTSYITPGFLYPSVLKLSGVTSQVKMGNQVIPSGKRTISFWYYNKGGNLTYSSLISNNDIFSDSNGMSIYWSTNTTLNFQNRKVGSGNYDVFATIPLNTWTYVVYNWDGTTNAYGMNLYINGIYSTSPDPATCTFTTEGAATYNMRVGANAAPGLEGSALYNSTFGYIQELIIENRVWSASEILTYYRKYQPI